MLDIGIVAGDQVAIQNLDAADGDVLCGAGSDGNGAGESGARGQSSRVALVLDGSRRRDRAGGYPSSVSRPSGVQ